jgi:hypothetical protein
MDRALGSEELMCCEQSSLVGQPERFIARLEMTEWMGLYVISVE